MNTTAGYDAFISYSHAADGKLAPALREGLEQLARPWSRRRALRVFQDTSGLAATPKLWSTIAGHLEQSRFLILLASPAAAASHWVRQEVEHFLGAHGAQAVLLALTDGDCRWDPNSGDFDWTASSAVPPQLGGAYAEEPLFVDLRWARNALQLTLRNPDFRRAVGDLAAPVHGLPRDEIDAQDLVQYRRSRRVRRVGTTAIAGLAVVATATATLAVVNSREARTQEASATRAAQLSEAGRLAALSLGNAPEETDLAVLLALHSLRTGDTAEGRLALATEMTLPAAARRILPGTEAGANAMALGPDDALAGADIGDGDIRVGRQSSGLGPTVLTGHTGVVMELSFSSDEALLASVDIPAALLVHEVGSAKTVMTVPDTADAEFVPGTHRLVVAGRDASVAQWEGGAGQPLWKMAGIGQPSTALFARTAVAVSHDGALVAVATNDKRILLLDAATGATVRSWSTGGSDVNDVAFSGSDRFIAGGGDDGVLRVWKTADGTAALERVSSPDGIRRLAWGEDDGTIATSGFDAHVRLHDTGSGGQLAGDLVAGTNPAVGLAFGADGDTLFGSSATGVRRWDLSTGRPRSILYGHDGVVRAVRFSPDGATLATQTGKQVWLWHTADDDAGPFAKLQIAGNDVAFTEDNRRILVASDSGRVHVFDAGSGAELGSIGSSTTTMSSVSVASTGDVAALDDNGTATVWSADGRPLWQQQVLSSADRLTFSADGALLAASGGRDEVVVVDARTGALLASPSGTKVTLQSGVTATSHFTPLAFSPDGSLLAVGRLNSQVELFDPRTGALVRSFVAHRGAVYSVAFSADGTVLATGGFNGGGLADSQQGLDGGLRLWDVTSGQKINDLNHHDGQVESVMFSPDGRLLATGSADREVLLWNAGPAWREQACAVAGRDLDDLERARYLKDNERAVRVC